MQAISGVAAYTDWSLLFLRVVVALVFGSSGFNHLKSPKAMQIRDIRAYAQKP